jgi:hypothetical protein
MRWMIKISNGVLLLPLALLLSACSEAPKVEKAKAPAKAPEPLTGRQAFQRMYPAARGWATDALPIQLRSVNLSQVKVEKGQAGAWQCMFVSTSHAKAKTYTYSSVEAEGNLHEGTFAGPEESYTARGQSFPFAIAAIRFDSDQAFDIAAEKSADYITKNPDKPVLYLLEQTSRFPVLTWRVIWGTSEGASDYSVFVDATMGKYLEKMH